MANTHSIDEQRIQISARGLADTASLNKELHHLNKDLEIIIGELFDQYFPSEKLIEINKISIDVGVLPTTGFQKDFKARFRQVLNRELMKLTKDTQFVSYVKSAKSIITNKFQVLEYYLSRGYLPPHFEADEFDINEQFQNMYISDAPRLINLFRQVWQNERKRKRILSQLSANNLQLINTRATSEGTQPHHDDLSDKLKFEAIRLFYLSGQLPSAYSSTPQSLLKQWVQYLLNKNNKALLDHLKEHLKSEAFRNRFITTLSLSDIKHVASRVFKNQYSAILIIELEKFERILQPLFANVPLASISDYKNFYLQYIIQSTRTEKERASDLMEFLTDNVLRSAGFTLSEKESHPNVIESIRQQHGLSHSKSGPLAIFLEQLEDQINIQQTAKTPESPLDIFFHFLSTGILHSEKSIDQIIQLLLAKYSVILKRAILDRWHEFPIRFRLAYQISENQLEEIIDLLFEEIAYLEWVKEIRGAIQAHKDSVEALNLGINWERHLYFSFFELYDLSRPNELSKNEFFDQLLLRWSLLVTDASALEPDHKQIVNPIDQLIMSIVDPAIGHERKGQESPWATIKNLAENGVEWDGYTRYHQTSELRTLFAQALMQPAHFFSEFKNYKFSLSFWSDIVPDLSEQQLLQLLKMSLPAHYSIVITLLSQIDDFITVFLSASGIEKGYSDRKQLIIFLIKHSAEKNFSLGQKQVLTTIFSNFFFPKQEALDSGTKLTKITASTSPFFAALQLFKMGTRELKSSSQLPLLSTLINALKWEDESGKGTESEPVDVNLSTAGVLSEYHGQFTTVDLIQHYFEKGIIPEWGGVNDEKGIIQLMRQSLVSGPEELIEGLVEIIKFQSARKRLIQLLGLKFIVQLFSQKRPASVLVFEEIYHDFNLLFDAGHLKSTSADDFDLYLSDQLIIGLFEQHRASFDVSQFILSLIDKVAQKYDIEREVMVAVFRNYRAQIKNETLKRSVITHHDIITNKELEKWQSKTEKQPHASIDIITHFLKLGQLPAWSSFDSPYSLSPLLGHGLKSDAQEVLSELARAVTKDVATSRLAQYFSLEVLNDLFLQKDQKRFEMLISVVKDIQTMFLSISSTKRDAGSFTNFLYHELTKAMFLPESLALNETRFAQSLLSKSLMRYPMQELSYPSSLSPYQELVKSKSMASLLVAHQKEWESDTSEKWHKKGIKKRFENVYSSRDLIHHFLVYGTLPDWSSIKTHKGVAQIIFEGLKIQKTVLLATINGLIGDDAAMERLVDLLSIKSQWTLQDAIDGENAKVFKEIFSDLKKFQQTTGFFVTSPKAFEKLIIRFVLKEMLLQQTQTLSLVHSLRNLLDALAGHLSKTYGSFTAKLAEHTENLKSQLLIEFLNETETLAFELTDGMTGMSSSDSLPEPYTPSYRQPEKMKWLHAGIKTSKQDQYDSADLIKHYLQSGTFPDWAGIDKPSDLSALIVDGITTYATRIHAILFSLENNEEAFHRLTEILNEVEVWQLLESVNVVHSRLLHSLVIDLIYYKKRTTSFIHSDKDFKKLLLAAAIKGVVHMQVSFVAVERVIDRLLDQVAHEYSITLNEILTGLYIQKQGLKSPELLLKIGKADFQESEILPANDEATTIPVNTAQGDIDLLFYLIKNKRYPWWFAPEEHTIPSGIEPHIQQLVEYLFLSHLDTLLTTILSAKDRLVYVKAIISITGKDAFYRLLNRLSPDVSGFAITCLMALEQWYSTQGKTISLEFYVFVFKYIDNYKASFSANHFLKKVSLFVSTETGVKVEGLLKDILRITEERITKGESRYLPLHDIVLGLKEQTWKESTKAEPESEEIMDTNDSKDLSVINFESQLSYFLTHHTFASAWASTYVDYSAFLKAYDDYFQKHQLSLKSLLLKVLASGYTFQQFLRKSDVQLFDRVAKALAPGKNVEINNWYEDFFQLMKATFPAVPDRNVGLVFWKVILKHLVERGSAEMTLELILKRLIDEFSVSQLPQIINELPDKLSALKGVVISTTFLTTIKQVLAEKRINEKRRSEEKEVVNDNQEKPIEEDEPIEGQILVNNAGMVILGVFLNRYFDMLGMLDDDEFKSTDEALRAVHLVQYLVTGETETPEHELLLNKVLCGVQITVPVPLSIELSDKEIDISSSLLAGVLQNWDKLSDSSVEALQETFLVRPGVLWETEGSFKLKVEKRTMDILLDYMPWSFNLIKLPWMQKPLEVEWL